jgi:hypothetical protein
MSNYDWQVTVRVMREGIDKSKGFPDGWTRTVVDTPVFELHSNPQFGGIFTQDGAAKTALNMFRELLTKDDTVYVRVSDLDGDQHKPYVFKYPATRIEQS